jgi:DNA recombination protein RmuC
MQSLAAGVGDLKRVLTNVKTRGTWGEVQLGALLEEILTPDQYARNVNTREGSRNVVEFAVRLPADGTHSIWLPIDAKFPQEDYQRLQDAAETADQQQVAACTAALVRSVTNAAREIADKYLDPPRTTDFAILFLATEGLYAEVLRQSGLVEILQREHRVMVAGPTSLAAILNSLRMGFRTLAIEQRSSEVWTLLATVKTEFERFGSQLAKARRQLDVAARAIDQTGTRTRVMARRLRQIERMPRDGMIEFSDSDDEQEPDDTEDEK